MTDFIGTPGDDFIRGGAANDFIDGGDGDDLIVDFRGSNVMLGGAGDDVFGSPSLGGLGGLAGVGYGQLIDVMTGGLGYDTYAVDISGLYFSTADIVTDFVTGSQGDIIHFGTMFGTFFSGVSISDPFNTSYLAFTQVGADTHVAVRAGSTNSLYGVLILQNVLASSLTLYNVQGIPGVTLPPSTLTGTAADNHLLGGISNDTILGLDGNDVLEGSIGDDLLSGGTGNDQLFGGRGNDRLDGGAGNDQIFGGLGTDTVDYSSAKSGVKVSLMLSGAQNTGGGGIDTLTGIEGMIGSQYNDTLESYEGFGGTPPRPIDGGAGVDTVTFVHFVSGVSASLGDGSEIKNVENLTGSDGDDLIEGNAGNNVLKGLGGIDELTYAHASASVHVNLSITAAQNTLGAGIDTLSGFENLTGSRFEDHLIGSSANNTLYGSDGNDILEGGRGQDVLAGGLGADRFVFNSVGDSSKSAPDYVADFTHLDGDKIDLSQMDADSNLAGQQSFTVVSAFTKHAGEMIVNPSGDITADLNGDGRFDFLILVNVRDTFGASDLIL